VRARLSSVIWHAMQLPALNEQRQHRVARNTPNILRAVLKVPVLTYAWWDRLHSALEKHGQAAWDASEEAGLAALASWLFTIPTDVSTSLEGVVRIVDSLHGLAKFIRQGSLSPVLCAQCVVMPRDMIAFFGKQTYTVCVTGPGNVWFNVDVVCTQDLLWPTVQFPSFR